MRKLQRFSGLFLVVASVGALGGCAHSYGRPAVVMIQAANGAMLDVAWVVQDGGRIVRCARAADSNLHCFAAHVH